MIPIFKENDNNTINIINIIIITVLIVIHHVSCVTQTDNLINLN